MLLLLLRNCLLPHTHTSLASVFVLDRYKHQRENEKQYTHTHTWKLAWSTSTQKHRDGNHWVLTGKRGGRRLYERRPCFFVFFIIILFVQIFVQTTLPSSPPKGTLSFHVAQKAFPMCVCMCNPSSYVHSYSHSKREIQFLCGQESILLLLTHTVWFFPHTHTHKNLIDWILLSILNRFFFLAVLIVQCLQCPGIPFFSQKGEAKLSDYIKMAAFCVCVCLSKRIERLCVIYTFEQMVFKKI